MMSVGPGEKPWARFSRSESQVLLSLPVFVKCMEIKQNSLFFLKDSYKRYDHEIESTQNSMFTYLVSKLYIPKRKLSCSQLIIEEMSTIVHKLSDKLGHHAGLSLSSWAEW